MAHKGTATDAGHYINFRLLLVQIYSDGPTPHGGTVGDEDKSWYKFDNEKLSIFPKKLSTLEGGGFSVCVFVVIAAMLIFFGVWGKTRRHLCWLIRVEREKNPLHGIKFLGLFPYFWHPA